MDLQALLGHWGYVAIFLVVVLGNVGLPVPEETVLILAGYLVWDGELRLLPVLAIGTLSAITGDNLGYWAGRELGRPAVERYGHRLLLTRDRLEYASRLVVRHGAAAVFAARFLPGLRFLAGPVAGITGLPPLTFILANICGALLYVPVAVGLGYAAGLGFGDRLTAIERTVGHVEHYILAVAALVTLGLFVRRAWRSARAPDREA